MCPRCGYTTPHLCNLHHHFERKYPCKPKLSKIPFENLYHVYYSCSGENTSNTYKNTSNTYKNTSNSDFNEEAKTESFKCSDCGKEYKHRQSLYHHRKKMHSENVEVQIKQLQEQVEDLMKSNSHQTINNNNSITNYNNSIFIVNSFGNENIDYINDDYVASRLKQPKQGINEIIRQIHFNPGRPENHNIKITNKKLPYASVYKNNTWELDDKKKVIDQIIHKSYGIMDCVYNDKQATLMPSTRRQYENFQTKFDENDPTLKKYLEKSTELQILNEQKLI